MSAFAAPSPSSSQSFVSGLWGQNGEDALDVVVFGASGDLASCKTFPALFSLFCQQFTPQNLSIVGFARTEKTDDEFRQHILPKLKGRLCRNNMRDAFLDRVRYVSANYDRAGCEKVLAALDDMRRSSGSGGKVNRLLYFALPPSAYVSAARAAEPLLACSGWSRCVFEKPFGRNLQTARELSAGLSAVLREDQIFRIDHYLGKEMVQNLMTLRFANPALSAFWSNEWVSNVQITFRETLDIQGRAGYFEEAGMLRDVMQNHLMQLLALTAMERPAPDEPDAIRDEKVRVLRCVPPIDASAAVLGQYARGRTADGGREHCGYREEEGVAPDSTTDTFVAAVLRVENARWRGVPFVIKCGKGLDSAKTDIRIQLKDPPAASRLVMQGCRQRGEPGAGEAEAEAFPRNELVIRVQPDEAVYVKIVGKVPGLEWRLHQTELDLTYRERYELPTPLPEAYERLLLDVFRGDAGDFVRADELEAAWAIFDPLLKQMDEKKIVPDPYPFGSRGPPRAEDLVREAGYVRVEGYEWPKAHPEQTSQAGPMAPGSPLSKKPAARAQTKPEVTSNQP